MNEELKKKVIDLLEYAKTNEPDKIIEYIDRNFIKTPNSVILILISILICKENQNSIKIMISLF